MLKRLTLFILVRYFKIGLSTCIQVGREMGMKGEAHFAWYLYGDQYTFTEIKRAVDGCGERRSNSEAI